MNLAVRKENALEGVRLVVLAGILTLASRVLLYGLFLQWKGGQNIGFFQALYQWDCGWYGTIVQSGYRGLSAIHPDGQAPWAFFPLAPLLERLIVAVTGLPLQVCGVIWNSFLLFLLTWAAGYYVKVSAGGGQQQLLLMALLNFGPYHVYYSTLYTEALFALLVCLFLICMRQKRWLLMGVCGALASATRNLGVFLVFAVLAFCIQQYLQQEELKTPWGFVRWVWQQPKLILGVCLVPLGLFSYMAYLDFLLGDALAFVRVQAGWGGTDGNPFRVLWDAFYHIGEENFYLALWGILAVYLCVRQMLRRKPECVASFFFVFIPLTARIMSVPRYVMCAFPILWELSDWLQTKGKLEKLFWCLVFAVIGASTAQQWFSGNWIVA